jgi:hypothetical protein
MASIGASRAECIKRSLAQSTSITAAWTWFMILVAKAAEPMLIGTPQVVFFGGRFIRAANSQSARYDTVVNTKGNRNDCQSGGSTQSRHSLDSL